ncbi:histidine kinase [Mesorhizobium sp. LHD-90]|uniref:sensor histidine kinase n=1 Tax=Mesorhizobium sp. LHD-90 TaxID=3071414 RepID=UPI0027DEBDB6|nr:histidine kinase [Mesorhizobium sp. LHD-90]MDQ6437576.1 histidine kinase [Mesorhizobium sp. LHD-90]
MNSSAGYAAPSGDRREARPRPSLFPWPVGADSFWVAHTVAWLFIAVFGLTSRLAAFDSVGLALALTLVLDPVGFALTALAHATLLRRSGFRPMAMAPLVLAYSVVGGLLQMQLAGWVKSNLVVIPAPAMAEDPSIPAIYYTTVFLAWSLAYFWVRAEIAARTERAQRSEAEAAAMRAELQHLRLQLDPHFLFNALNTLSAEIQERPQAALEMTRRIAAYLRYSLDKQNRQVCPLADEIEAVRAYVRIQELRFEDRLRCRIEVDPAARSVAVPHLVVQGLVENAIKHGLRSPAETLLVGVSVRRTDGDTTVIEVTNPGRLSAQAGAGPAVGLANTRRRLELHYPQRHELSLTQDGERVVARLALRGSACFV